MRLRVFFTPSEISSTSASPADVYIVIDIIRATTSIAVLIDRGAERILIADTLEQARMAKSIYPDSLLCGERRALPPPGFDYGNSPANFARERFDRETLILTTTNGTKALYACPKESYRLAGCLYNAYAITQQAISYAEAHTSSINLVCAGLGGRFALDDAACAGYLTRELYNQRPGLELEESAHAALALYEAFPSTRLLKYCYAAHAVSSAGLTEDLELCMQVNRSQAIPHVTDQDAKTGLLIITRA